MNGLAVAAAIGLAAAQYPSPLTGWPDLSHPPMGPGADGQHDAAVVVGIEAYASVPDVPSARENADDWVRWLARTRGVPLSRIHHVVDQRAEADRILTAVDRAVDQVQDGGTLWMVFIGRSSAGNAEVSPALLAVNARAGDSGGRVDPDVLLERLAGGAGSQAVMVVDAGAVVRSTAKVAVLSGDSVSASPATLDASGRPAWSYLVLGGLHGWADADADGSVTARELSRYARDGLSVVQPDLIQSEGWSGPDVLLAQGVRATGPDLVERTIAYSDGALIGGGAPSALAARARQAAAMEAVERAAQSRSGAAFEAAVQARAAQLVAASADVRQAATQDWAALRAARDSGGDRSIDLVEAFIDAYATVRVELDDHSRQVDVPEVDLARTWLADAVRARGTDPLSRPELAPGTPLADVERVESAWLACAALSDPTACAFLGQHYELGLGGLALNPAKAVALYERGCDHLAAAACRQLGTVLTQGVGIAPDLVRARGLLGVACDLEDGRACGMLATLVRSEVGGPAGLGRSADLLARGCVLEDGPSCRLLAEQLPLDAPPAEGEELLDRACALGEAEACAPAGERSTIEEGAVRITASALERPEFVVDADASQRQKGSEDWDDCRTERDPMACNRLAYSYERGERGVVRDLQKAAEYYARACDRGVAIACGNVGFLLESGQLGSRDYASASVRYQTGCSAGNGRSCGNLGMLYDSGDGVPRDLQRANDLFLRGCDLGSGAACTNLGFSYEQGRGVPVMERRALALYRTGCEQGNYRGCGNLGYLLWTGQPRRQDHPRAREYMRMACENQDARACNNVAIMMGDGVGGPIDHAASNRYMELGCRGGDANACRNLGLRYREGKRGLYASLEAARIYLQQACTLGSAESCADLEALE